MKFKIISGSFKIGNTIELDEVIEPQDLPGITLEESKKFWGHKDIYVNFYSKEDITEAIEENQDGHDWKLIYIHGYSLRELWEKHTDFFWSKSEPWYLEKGEKFADEKCNAGYYLMDFSKQLTSLNWNEQQKKLDSLGFTRAPLCAVIEAAISLYKIKNEIVLENWYHWSDTRSSDGLLVHFGRVDATGAYVSGSEPGYSYGILGAVPVR